MFLFSWYWELVITVVLIGGFIFLYSWWENVKILKFKRGFYKWTAKDLSDYLVNNIDMDRNFYAVCDEIESREKFGISDDSFIRANEQPGDYVKCVRVGYDLHECPCKRCIELDIQREKGK